MQQSVEVTRAATRRMPDEVVTTVSHELRTPLASIIGYAELLADLGEEHLSPTARRMLDAIARNARREHQLVADLLASTCEDPASGLCLTAVDLHGILSACAARWASRARAGGVALRVVPPPVGVAALADARRVARAVEHLVDNAVKFSPGGGRVELAVRGAGEHAEVVVRDEGMGMAPDEAVLAAERFYRAPAVVRAQIRGAGLGLSLVRDTVEAHGGCVRLESESGAGTTVTVVLPLGGP